MVIKLAFNNHKSLILTIFLVNDTHVLGLEYLHNGCTPPMIHRDIKSSNILLNENLRAKLADFGLSRAFPIEANATHVTTKVVGTLGYLDPEYVFFNMFK